MMASFTYAYTYNTTERPPASNNTNAYRSLYIFIQCVVLDWWSQVSKISLCRHKQKTDIFDQQFPSRNKTHENACHTKNSRQMKTWLSNYKNTITWYRYTIVTALNWAHCFWPVAVIFNLYENTISCVVVQISVAVSNTGKAVWLFSQVCTGDRYGYSQHISWHG